MEVIKKQSLQSTLIQVTGALIGALSTIFIYPLDLTLYGIYGFLTNTASLLVPFISLGFGAVLLRFFPYFNAPANNHGGFFGFISSGYALGILLFTLAFALFFPFIHHFLTWHNASSGWYIIYILPITILYVVLDLFTTISINFQRITAPAFVIFLMKLFLPLIFILCVRQYLDRIHFVWLIGGYYICVIGLMMMYLKKIGTLHIGFNKNMFTHPLRKQMLQFAGFSILGGASAVLALRIDSILITSLKGPEANGLFTLAIFISNVAYIPASALTDSLNAVVSSISKQADTSALQRIYSKSSKNMLIPTMWIAICIYSGFLSLSQLMPNSEKVAWIHLVIAWLLLARIVDAATGVNHHILSYSRFYPIELYLLMLMAALNILFNFLLIPQYGIQGAACATFISVCVYNILKTAMVYVRLGIHPFSKSLGIIILLGIGIALAFTQVPLNFHPLINILIISSCISTLFLGSIYFFKLSQEFNEMIHVLIKKTKERF